MEAQLAMNGATAAKAAANAAKEPRNIYQRLHAVMADVGYVQKDGVNTHFKYRFVSESAVVEKVRTAMLAHGLFITPSARQVTVTPGERQNLTLLTVDYTLVNIDVPDEQITLRWYGEGADSGDKGLAKASTNAHKYMFMRLFQIATGDDAEADPDTDSAAEKRARAVAAATRPRNTEQNRQPTPSGGREWRYAPTFPDKERYKEAAKKAGVKTFFDSPSKEWIASGEIPGWDAACVLRPDGTNHEASEVPEAPPIDDQDISF